ncbi:MAG: BolA family transcriptional regulator [Candidatus Liberibacter ctenarytainae]|uniref:BolA family transcriptional regulator n=1 Tax=Candidatus Liberibacter ctenarytainae TaxID=2020335 RepID=A0A937DLW9_9HYPH|nr:BolA family transcriptional regulator [Candidatus Liberibacter ctenarytainae]
MKKSHKSLIDKITEKIRIALSPEELKVINESHLHIQHQPQFDGSGETHLRIQIISKEFIGIKSILRHKKIYTLLHTEITSELHALSIEAFSPDERHTFDD